MIENKETLEKLQCVLALFVDDTGIMINGKAAQQMCQMVGIYDRLYGAVGGCIEEKKTIFYAQKQFQKQY